MDLQSKYGLVVYWTLGYFMVNGLCFVAEMAL